MRARHRLDAREQIRAVLGLGEHRADRAAPDRDGRDAVAHRLAQRRRRDDLRVVVRVQVDEPRHHPLALRVDDLAAPALVERLGALFDHAPVANSHVHPLAGRARPVEAEAVLDDDVEAHDRSVT